MYTFPSPPPPPPCPSLTFSTRLSSDLAPSLSTAHPQPLCKTPHSGAPAAKKDPNCDGSEVPPPHSEPGTAQPSPLPPPTRRRRPHPAAAAAAGWAALSPQPPHHLNAAPQPSCRRRHADPLPAPSALSRETSCGTGGRRAAQQTWRRRRKGAAAARGGGGEWGLPAPRLCGGRPPGCSSSAGAGLRAEGQAEG